MDIWRATAEQIKTAALKYYGKYPISILKQTGYWAYVFFPDGTSETVYAYMVG